MAGTSNSGNATTPWLIGALLALSLGVVVPIHLSHRFFPAGHTVHAGVRAAHHTVVDRIGGRLAARIDRFGRTAAPGRRVTPMLFALVAPSVTPRASATPPRARMLRHLRIARNRDGDGDPPSHARSLRV
jgi:hypothetical protein